MTNIAKFNVALSGLIDVPNPNDTKHPFATIARFIFADDQPNGNKQGIRVEEFPNIINSAIGMPIKMNFTGFGVANHGGSIPIGHIRSLEATKEGTINQLIAEAMLWKEEFPDEIEYLKNAYAEGNAPGLSYEIGFKDSVRENDTEWIKDTTTMAATFVRDPAYGSRTHLLALASLDEEERNVEILALAEQIKTDQEPKNEGGNLMEEELERLRAEAVTNTARITELEGQLATAATEKDTAVADLTTATAELETLKTEAEVAKADAKTEARVRQYVEAGFVMDEDAEKATARKTVFASFEDAQWDFYLTSLKTNVETKKKEEDKGHAAFASLMRPSNDMPKIEVLDEDKNSLKDAMRTLARPHSI